METNKNVFFFFFAFKSSGESANETDWEVEGRREQKLNLKRVLKTGSILTSQ